MIGMLAPLIVLAASAPTYAAAPSHGTIKQTAAPIEPPATGDWRSIFRDQGRTLGLDVSHVELQGGKRLLWVAVVSTSTRAGSYSVARMELDCDAETVRALWLGMQTGLGDPMIGASMQEEARPYSEGSSPAAIAAVVCDGAAVPDSGARTHQEFAATALAG